MAVVNGTIRSIELLRAHDNQSSTKRYVYHVTFDLATATAGDTFALLTVATAIATTNQKSGKTLTLREASAGMPGMSLGGTAVHASGVSVSTTSITGVVGGPTAVAAVAGCQSVGVVCCLDES